MIGFENFRSQKTAVRQLSARLTNPNFPWNFLRFQIAKMIGFKNFTFQK
jgi:hypothetical protein